MPENTPEPVELTDRELLEELEDIRRFQRDQAEAYLNIRGPIENRIAQRGDCDCNAGYRDPEICPRCGEVIALSDTEIEFGLKCATCMWWGE